MKIYGVFIGIDNYKDKNIRRLNYAKSDAERFFLAVSNRFSEDERKCWLLTDEQATKKQIVYTVGEVIAGQASEEDIVLIFFSGHGSPEKSQAIDKVSKYLILYDTEFDRIFTTGLDLEQELVRLLQRIRSKIVVLFVDSCFSGRAGGRTFEGPVLAQMREDYRDGIRLSDLQLGEGRILIAACNDDQVAYENSDLGQGIFSYFLLKLLTNDLQNESSVGINSLYEQIAKQVHEYTKGRQTPVMNGRVRMMRFPILSI